MIDRRVSPRNRCPIALTYRVLDDQAYRELMETFANKRNRVVLYDQLEFKNNRVNRALKELDNTISEILCDLNDQLGALTKTLAMDFDVLQQQENSEAIINLGGMLMQTEEALATGKVIELQLKLAPHIPRLLIVAEVLRSESHRHNKYTTAIAFTYIEPDDKQILKDFVDSRLKQNFSEQRAS